ncbi:ATP-binding protein [Streptomyces sannanensis]|uniref:ATP-binding protein n=1 Tax=Streptomyces sannanensis TaxID=285536 RepID=A0ABP6S6J2_9ACTN
MTTTPAATGIPAYTESLPCKTASARPARLLVSTALHVWDLGALVEDAELVVTELVANSARHSKCRLLRVTISRLSGDRVRVAVIDRSNALPQPRAAGETDEGGRGLVVVEALSDRWGTDMLRWGKRVWAELASPDR